MTPVYLVYSENDKQSFGAMVLCNAVDGWIHEATFMTNIPVAKSGVTCSGPFDFEKLVHLKYNSPILGNIEDEMNRYELTAKERQRVREAKEKLYPTLPQHAATIKGPVTLVV